ncbi:MULTISPECIES: cysteine dioxygenase [Streptomyces]|uniref:Cysteine dioxygenase n=2 Tax=Streptomyces TaxID=1883 RepID=A0A100Y0Z2_9ACTN|nr:MULTISPECIES: cysteine dioxygenase family protein [Streptomyces]KUH35672.1 cysteine dioxygenase [Streptomyces kanasensis]UUS29783.1 cysteine dioxygenase family protein [Streptomyces changanensis]
MSVVPSPALLGPARLAGLAASFAARRDLWLPAVRFTHPDRHYTRLERADTHEVWLLTWLPGQGTEIHGHGGSSGAFTVVRGELTERVFPPSSHPSHPVPRRLGAGATRSFGPRHVHSVVNGGASPAVSVHAYAPALATMTYYRRLPDGRLVTDRIEGVDA